ncbi:hypothetical protein GCM10009760_48330 [Kitasatospora kazusensis]|uniref:Uncharacterized protein n=1 Tax=Kitasatospora kazusensis TaxID=407974 RepID=A0ABN3A2Q9_9ACTN
MTLVRSLTLERAEHPPDGLEIPAQPGVSEVCGLPLGLGPRPAAVVVARDRPAYRGNQADAGVDDDLVGSVEYPAYRPARPAGTR